MPLFNESYDASPPERKPNTGNSIYSLTDCFTRNIPITSIEFNPPVVSSLHKQSSDYWLNLEEPDAEDEKVLAGLRTKMQAMVRCRQSGSFMSITDSAAGILRMHNIVMLRLLEDPGFTQKWLHAPPASFQHQRTVLHLTRNHSITWLRGFFKAARERGLNQLLIITGDPLKEVRLQTVRAAEIPALTPQQEETSRLKNSVELLCFIRDAAPDFFLGAAHNPFLKPEAAHKHLLNKVNAGAEFLVSQPVSYYDECWEAMARYEAFCAEAQLSIPMILGVFNYAVPCGPLGYKPEAFEKRYKFWKRLFGFVPDGVRCDYDLGLNGVEILARSINKLKRMGYFHFDVMNAESNGYSVVIKGRNFTHELDRLVGVFDTDAPKKPGVL